MQDIEINLDAQIGQIAQRIADLTKAEEAPPAELKGAKIREFTEAVRTEITLLQSTITLIRERARALDDATVVVASLSPKDLADTEEALRLLDKEVKKDETAKAILDLLPKLTTAASRILSTAGSATKKS